MTYYTIYFRWWRIYCTFFPTIKILKKIRITCPLTELHLLNFRAFAVNYNSQFNEISPFKILYILLFQICILVVKFMCSMWWLEYKNFVLDLIQERQFSGGVIGLPVVFIQQESASLFSNHILPLPSLYLPGRITAYDD